LADGERCLCGATDQMERKQKQLLNQVSNIAPGKGAQPWHAGPAGAAEFGEFQGIPPEGYIDVRHEFTPPSQPFLVGDGLAITVGAPSIHACTHGSLA
jgi:hypothetical protein